MNGEGSTKTWTVAVAILTKQTAIKETHQISSQWKRWKVKRIWTSAEEFCPAYFVGSVVNWFIN